MATVEQAEQFENQVMMNASRDSLSATVRITEAGGNGIMQAMNALNDAVKQWSQGHDQRSGQVSMRTFKSNLTGDREIVELSDQRVAATLSKELKRLDVQFAIATPEKGVREFHVQSRDAKVLVHALDRAEKAVYAREDDAQVKRDIAEKVKDAALALDNGESRDARQQQLVRDDALVFPTYKMVGEADSTVNLNKSGALDLINDTKGRTLSTEPRQLGYDIKGWIGKDADVDRAIARNHPQLMTERQLADTKHDLGRAAKHATPHLDEIEPRGKTR